MSSTGTDFVTANKTLNIPPQPVKNTGNVAMTVGQLTKLDTSNLVSGSQPQVGVKLTSAVTDEPYGVVGCNIPVGGYGYVYGVEGQELWMIADSAGTIAAGAIVGPSGATAGAITAYTAGDPSCGQSLTAGVNAADAVLVRWGTKPTT